MATTASTERLPRVGQVVGSKYRIDRVLGMGGMGTVVAATHLPLDKLVALKFIHPESAMDESAVRRFEREARIAASLKSNHVVRITDIGRLDIDTPYIEMEHLDGLDLSKLLSRGRLSIGEASEYVIQACDAIAEAHETGVIHRDLKPANLFLAHGARDRRTIKVLDFGLSKRHGACDGLAPTQAHVVMGSPHYMSPEQMRSTKHVDAATDIWALGVILYELVAGRRPFQGDSFAALCIQVATAPTPRLPPLDDPRAADLERVVCRALEKRAGFRYPSARALARALAPLASGTGRAADSMTRTWRPAPTPKPSMSTLTARPSIGLGASEIPATCEGRDGRACRSGWA